MARAILTLRADSYLEYAFLRWVLAAAATDDIAPYVTPQAEVVVDGHRYRVDYEIRGEVYRFAVELDGFEHHGTRSAFTHDRLRQNDVHASGRLVIRFSYDSIRLETARCVAQLQALLRLDPTLERILVPNPKVERPDMDPDPLFALSLPPTSPKKHRPSYFDRVRSHLNLKTLRACQHEAFSALANYYRAGGERAACVMSVGAGKTALGVAACLAFTHRRALIVTPGNVILGTFGRALDHESPRNALNGLPRGPLIPGSPPPKVLTLSREKEESGVRPIKLVTRDELLASDVIVTNFHALGDGGDPDDLLGKLRPDDVDLLVIDEAHIAATDSYQRAFEHFRGARALLMSACFQRLDGKPIEADVVYRYRLIDSIADGNAKNLRVHRFAPDVAQTVYEMVWPDGRREELRGRDAILGLLHDERKLAHVTAKSHEPIRQVMRAVRAALDEQAKLLRPVKPRVLFSALGERHAEQIAAIATEHGIPSAYVHHAMTTSRIKALRARFEEESGDLQGLAQLKMLGQGYDFPAITVVVPMRPYGSFGEFYQFVGRGIRVLHHPAFEGRVKPSDQYLDVIYHAELALDGHIETIYRENDMDPSAVLGLPSPSPRAAPLEVPGTRGHDVASRPEAFVLFEQGALHQRVVHDQARVDQRRAERELEGLAQKYAAYAASSPSPVTFEQYVELMREDHG
ncbi:MAG TPA: DEAD/DEAH box helicase family protein [Polyangiaceae bacterium]|nr:DEAD/DEAH box helicase family protein [Polyangiaceae bacterium]